MTKYNLIFVMFVSGMLTACVEPTPRMDAEFGNATRATLNAHVINQDAGNNTDTVTGLDGQAARDALYNYQKSFTKPEPKDPVTINVNDSR